MLVNLRTARYNKRNTAAPTAAQSAANSYRSRRRLQRTNNRFLFGLRSSSSSSTSASWWLHRQWKQHSTVSLIPALVAATTTLCSRCSEISVSISISRFYDSTIRFASTRLRLCFRLRAQKDAATVQLPAPARQRVSVCGLKLKYNKSILNEKNSAKHITTTTTSTVERSEKNPKQKKIIETVQQLQLHLFCKFKRASVCVSAFTYYLHIYTQIYTIYSYILYIPSMLYTS